MIHIPYLQIYYELKQFTQKEKDKKERKRRDGGEGTCSKYVCTHWKTPLWLSSSPPQKVAEDLGFHISQRPTQYPVRKSGSKPAVASRAAKDPIPSISIRKLLGRANEHYDVIFRIFRDC